MIPGEKRVLLIDSYQATREARTAVLRHYGIEVFPADNFALARSLWEPAYYHLVLIDIRRYLPGETLEFCREVKEKTPGQRIAFLTGPPHYLSLTWPDEFMPKRRAAAA